MREVWRNEKQQILIEESGGDTSAGQSEESFMHVS